MFCVTKCGLKTEAPSYAVAAQWNTTSTPRVRAAIRSQSLQSALWNSTPAGMLSS